MKHAFLMAGLWLAAASPAAVELRTNIQNGATVKGEIVFRVTATAKNPVTSVEFYVGDELRDSDTSTPYEFRFDTLSVDDGPLRVRFRGYTAEGEQGERVLNLTVDNGVGKGAAANVAIAEDFLADSKWDEAIAAGRVALKADPNSVPARMVLARANLGKGVLDTAQKFAEDAAAATPTASAPRELLATIHIRRAFQITSRGDNRADALAAITSSFRSAVQNRKQSLDLAVDRLGPVTPANRLAVSDAAIRAGRYGLVVSTLGPVHEREAKRPEIANRLAFALMNLGRNSDAARVVADLERANQMDAYAWALRAVLLIEANEDAKSDDAMREALLADVENLGVRTAQAYIALKRDRANVLSRLAIDMARQEQGAAIVQFYLCALSNRARQFAEARDYARQSLLIEPAFVPTYIEQSIAAVGLALSPRSDENQRKFQFDFAKASLDAALIAREDSPEVLTGQAILALFQKRLDDAVTFARGAVAAGPEYAAGHYALAAAYNAQAAAERDQAKQRNLVALASQANVRAGQLDRRGLEGRVVPNVDAAWRYYVTGGRTPVISAPR